jgi:hypothetical protein
MQCNIADFAHIILCDTVKYPWPLSIVGKYNVGNKKI